ncbi:MAG: proton-conducting transporter transmembrane domain-containing protein [Chloroflexota bacterium]
MTASLAFIAIWLALGPLLLALGRLGIPFASAALSWRLLALALTAAALVASLVLGWTAPAVPFARWSQGLLFDSVARVLLPPLWIAAAAIISVSIYSEVGSRVLPALAAFVAAVATAGILSSSALLTIMAIQVGAFATLAGLLLGQGSQPADGLFRVATSLKFLTLSVVAASSLLVSLVLANFYSANQDHAELPRIVASLLVVGFGITVAAAPFYFHLPDLLDASPPVVSALLLGPLQCLAFVYVIRTFSSDPWLLADDHVSSILTVGALAGALLAGLLGLGQGGTVRLIAFSSVQEAGWLAFGLGSASTLGWQGSIALLAVRTVAKPMLLLSTGQILGPGPGRLQSVERKLWGSALLLTLVWCVGVGTTLGIPPAGGFWGMSRLIRESIALGPLPAGLLVASLALSVAAYGRVVVRPLRARLAPPRFSLARSEAVPTVVLVALAGGLVVAGLLHGGFGANINYVVQGFPFLR